MYSTLACPRHTYRLHPLHQWSSCLMSSTTRSDSRLTVEWSLVRSLLPWHSMATSNITSSSVQSHSLLWDNTCRTLSASSLSATTEDDHHCKNQRQNENKYHTDRFGTCFEATSTSHSQNQHHSRLQVLTAALTLSECVFHGETFQSIFT